MREKEKGWAREKKEEIKEEKEGTGRTKKVEEGDRRGMEISRGKGGKEEITEENRQNMQMKAKMALQYFSIFPHIGEKSDGNLRVQTVAKKTCEIAHV